MHINGIEFLFTISRAARFYTSEALENRKSETLLTSIDRTRTTYARPRLSDEQSRRRQLIWPTGGWSIKPKDSVEYCIERWACIIKWKGTFALFRRDVGQSITRFPLKKIPFKMVVEMVYAMIISIHALPVVDGTSATLSPRKIVTGVAIGATEHCVVTLGANPRTAR